MRVDDVTIDRFNDKYIPVTECGCWVWLGAIRGENNYGAMRINKRTIGAHRVSYMIHHGNIPDEMQVLHKCDNRLCVNPEHLYAGNQKQNIRDMYNRGRNVYTGNKGTKHPSSKITEDIVIEIRLSKLSEKELCEKYKLSRSHVSRIINNKSWRHI